MSAIGDFLKKTIDKFNINTEVKTKQSKYLSKDEKWDILKMFYDYRFKDNKDLKIIKNDKSLTIEFLFPNKDEALEFSNTPSVKLVTFTNKFLEKKDIKFNEYDIFYNLVITHDENGKTPNLVTVRLGQ